jgi:hypothetical protein
MQLLYRSVTQSDWHLLACCEFARTNRRLFMKSEKEIRSNDA